MLVEYLLHVTASEETWVEVFLSFRILPRCSLFGTKAGLLEADPYFTPDMLLIPSEQMRFKVILPMLMSIMLAFVLFVLRFPSCLLWCLINAWFLSHSAFYTHWLNEMSHFIFQFMQLENDFIAFIITLNCQWCMMYGSFDSLNWRHWLIMLLYLHLWFCQSGCLGHNLPLFTENIPFSTLSVWIVAKTLLLNT